MHGVCRPLTTKSHCLRLIRRPHLPHFLSDTSRWVKPTEAQASASRHRALLSKDTGASVQRGSSREGAGKKNAPDSAVSFARRAAVASSLASFHAAKHAFTCSAPGGPCWAGNLLVRGGRQETMQDCLLPRPANSSVDVPDLTREAVPCCRAQADTLAPWGVVHAGSASDGRCRPGFLSRWVPS